MSRVARTVLVLALPALILQSIATAESPAIRLVPKEAALVLEVSQPKAFLDFALNSKVIDRITATPAYKQQVSQGPLKDLFNGVRYMESRLGTDWKTSLHKLLDGGITLAVQPDGGVFVIVDAQDGALLRDLHKALVEIFQMEAAKAGQPRRVTSKEVLGVTQWTFNGEEAHAIVGNRLILANKASVLKTVLEQHNKPSSTSLALLPAYQAVRKTLGNQAVATVFANLAMLRKNPAVQQGLKQTSEPMASLLLAGLIDPLRDAQWLGLGLGIEGGTLTLEAVADGKIPQASNPSAFTWPSQADGALPNFQVPRQILGISLYRDLYAFYGAKDKLFPERTGGIIFFENLMGIFFSGRDLTTEVFKETRPHLRLVVAAQEYDKATGTPQIQLPGFALVFRLHHPQEFTRVVEEAWQKAVGLINVTRGQKAQAGMILDRDFHKGVKYTVLTFGQGKDEEKESHGFLLNFRPSLVRVGDFLVFSSTEGLLKDLIEALQKEVKEPSKAVAGSHSLLEVDGAQLAAILQANRQKPGDQQHAPKRQFQGTGRKRDQCPAFPGQASGSGQADHGKQRRQVPQQPGNQVGLALNRGAPMVAEPHKPTASVDPAWAWAPYRPDRERPWNLRRIGHFYRRAAFGASWSQLQKALGAGPAATVDSLVRPPADAADFNRTFDDYEASSIDSGTGSVDVLGTWWLRRMIQTPQPLLEKMTLFWHNHFAASNLQVQSGWLMYRHLKMLRRHALGLFPPLLAAIVRDPAMLLGLEAQANRKAQPTETFARTLLEEFCLGPGQASPTDVHETARALTGWTVLRSQSRFLAHEHDDGSKTILGEKGNWTDEDVVRILVKQSAASRLLARKCYRWLISETEEPSDALLAPLAESFARDQDFGRLVETMLRSNLFFSDQVYRQRIKSPVDFALGIICGLEAVVPTAQLGLDLAALGQHLGQPATVKGWPGGTAWINQATFRGRNNLALALLAGGEPYGNKLDPQAVASKHGHSKPEQAGRFLLDLFLQGDLPDKAARLLLQTATAGEGDLSSRLRRLVHGLVTLPEFQLS